MERTTTDRTGTSEGVRGESEIQRARKAGIKEGAGRSVAQSFCLVAGLALIGVGVLGFFFGGSDFNTGANVQGEQFLGFEVNGWHNVVHIATGGFLLLMAATARSAIAGLFVFAAAYLAVMVWGFIDGSDVANLIPVNTADNILHAVLAGGALFAALVAGGLLEKGRRERPSPRAG